MLMSFSSAGFQLEVKPTPVGVAQVCDAASVSPRMIPALVLRQRALHRTTELGVMPEAVNVISWPEAETNTTEPGPLTMMQFPVPTNTPDRPLPVEIAPFILATTELQPAKAVTAMASMLSSKIATRAALPSGRNQNEFRSTRIFTFLLLG